MKNKIFFIAIPALALVAYMLLTWQMQSAVSAEVRPVEKTTIGGDFSLTNQHNKIVKSTDFRGKLMLVFFGFTSCPDECPTAMMHITQALNMLGKASTEIVPIFITVDPKRDDVKTLADYVANFHPSTVALTGELEDLKKAQAAYKIYASEHADVKTKTYMVNHSAFIYLMNRNGEYVAHFAHDISPENLAVSLRKFIGDK